MVRIDHAASYFMPLLCSSKPYVRVNCVVVTMLLFVALLCSYGFMGKQYDEPNLFMPNAQDYFRASLLGVFSPMLYYFVQTFLINLNRRYLVANFIVDFPLNDWFILLIIVCLAYPQQQQHQSHHRDDDTIWHIVPRQTYIFGVAWSLGELIVSVLGNLFNYREIPEELEASQESQLLDRNSGSSTNRDDITLSKCLDVRRDSSSISNNVYYSEIDAQNNQKGYGTMSDDGEAAVLLVNSNDNSLKLAPLEYDRDPRIMEQQRQWGALVGMAETQAANGFPIKKFKAIKSNWSLFKALCTMVLVLLSNIMLIVGQCLITSIYFTYVPGHQRIFTPVVNFFGQRTVTFFLSTVMLPFTVINLAANAAIYSWKDLDEWFYCRPRDLDHDLYYDSEASLQRSRPTTTSWIPPPPLQIPDLGFSDPSLLVQESFQPNEPRTLHYAKKTVKLWQRLAKKDSFVLVSMTIWGIAVFTTGFLATVPH
ncbi:hypothetical protein ZYGR_0I03910 [Zygosaccharomyces rouxii]|uniref:ZYRO0C09328p n=2 Tax=Zygosaccharomyces rouxii TaxID=4956 RepID=C5DTK7_ZYGRC|nr:uncharacterized protein ZYRO0C09328g [Zygosaccharomyces rouxii]KAH9201703.1 hypothetical protein LQ764DRAFT_84358 [Zygosaccharomyces rouxii]GAV48094.1 hypothetical protein ZYGR_0I03910 [Zygosaccharomyces rouxii]CAR27118.1 ZYRO0C09328p [Zygosaccharomyces rouxii]